MNDIVLEPMTTSTNTQQQHAGGLNPFYIGILLAVASSLFIGSSFILKKKGLLKLMNYHGTIRAGSGGFGYLREVQWWAGLITMGLGELCNFAAYGFAPASVVTPLGALSVLVSALLAVRFLDEKLNKLGKIGCLLTICGSIIIVIHAPKESEVNSLLDFARKIGAIEFVLFSLLTCITILCLVVYYVPRLGSKQVHIYVLICSLLGAFTVTACKGLAVGLKEIFTHEHTFSIWLTVACAVVIIVCIIVQMVYLNRALDLFSTPIVTTVYYVLFTTCVLITSGVMFREWRRLSLVDIAACLVGFLTTICGLVLINYLKSSALPSSGPPLAHADPVTPLPSFASQHQPSLRGSSSSSLVVPARSYSNLILDESDLSISTNFLNEQRQPMLSMNERDLNC